MTLRTYYPYVCESLALGARGARQWCAPRRQDLGGGGGAPTEGHKKEGTNRSLRIKRNHTIRKRNLVTVAHPIYSTQKESLIVLFSLFLYYL